MASEPDSDLLTEPNDEQSKVHDVQNLFSSEDKNRTDPDSTDIYTEKIEQESSQPTLDTDFPVVKAKTTPAQTSVYASYREISSDNDSDQDVTAQAATSITESSCSSMTDISPNHRLLYNADSDTSDYASPLHLRREPAREDTGSDSMTTDSNVGNNAAQFDPQRPESLPLSRSVPHSRRKHHQRRKTADNIIASSSTDALIEEAVRTPLHAQGSVTRQGEMIAFVADDLTDMIKLSSPASRTSESSVPSSPASAASDLTSSASEWSRDYSRMSRSPSILTASPDDIPPVDSRALQEVEAHAQKAANSVHQLLGSLHKHLFKMSALSFHCLDAHRDGVDRTCDSVDASIKAMYALMAKSEELSKNMEPVYSLQTEIQDIQRLLDKFEQQMARMDK